MSCEEAGRGGRSFSGAGGRAGPRTRFGAAGGGAGPRILRSLLDGGLAARSFVGGELLSSLSTSSSADRLRFARWGGSSGPTEGMAAEFDVVEKKMRLHR